MAQRKAGSGQAKALEETTEETVQEAPPDPREALGQRFALDLWTSWQQHGPKAIEAVWTEKPDLYVKLVTALLPKPAEPKPEAEALDDDALDRRIFSLAAALGLAIGPGPRAGRKGPANGA